MPTTPTERRLRAALVRSDTLLVRVSECYRRARETTRDYERTTDRVAGDDALRAVADYVQERLR